MGPRMAPPLLLLEGVAQFNRGEYFEQHETLERLWRAEKRPIRRLYQGILQIGVAFFHLHRGNFHGTMVMLERGLTHLRSCPPVCQSVVVADLVAAAGSALAALKDLGPGRLDQFDWRLAPRVQLVNRPSGTRPPRSASRTRTPP